MKTPRHLGKEITLPSRCLSLWNVETPMRSMVFIVGRSRQHLTEQRPRFQVDRQQQEQITVKFLEVTNQGNLEDLLSLLAKDVTYWSDGGGQVAAALKPLHGAMKVAWFLLALYSKRLKTAVSYLIEVNGQPGVMVIIGDRIQSVTTFDIVDGSIQSIYTMRNPEKGRILRCLPQTSDAPYANRHGLL